MAIFFFAAHVALPFHSLCVGQDENMVANYTKALLYDATSIVEQKCEYKMNNEQTCLACKQLWTLYPQHESIKLKMSILM